MLILQSVNSVKGIKKVISSSAKSNRPHIIDVIYYCMKACTGLWKKH